MAKNPMNYLDDTQFYRWMAVCAKKNLKSNNLLRGVIVDYTNKNLSDAEFEEYVRKTRSVGIAERLIRKPVTQNIKIDNSEIGAVKIENDSKSLTEKDIFVIRSDWVTNIDEVSSGDDITSEKIKVIREMYGGKTGKV